jgi:hypothetical protein
MESLRPYTEAPEVEEVDIPVETTGVLGGVRGALPPLGVEAPILEAGKSPAEVAEALVSRAQLFQNLISQPVSAPVPDARKRVVTAAARAQRGMVAVMLVLLAVVVGVLLSPDVLPFRLPAMTHPVASPAVDRMYAAVQEIGSGTPVVIAFEYGPTEADELNLVAVPILRHMLARGAQITVGSTRPDGERMAVSLLEEIITSNAQYTETEYTLLGYRPGDMAGVSQLLSDASEGAAEPRMIVVLTAHPTALRHWIEQTQSRFGGRVPVLAGLSAALEPVASPYLDIGSGQLIGATSGMGGAAADEALLGETGSATQRLNALAVSHLLIVGVIILGAVFYAPTSLRRRKT